MLEQVVRKVDCPYCGERFEAIIDCSVAEQDYIEDCWICCRPINFVVVVDGDEPSITTSTDNE